MQKTTLDVYHKKTLERITSNVASIRCMESQMMILDEKIKKYSNVNKAELSDEIFEEYMKNIDERKSIKDQIEIISQTNDENNYYTNTSDILYKYYDFIENGGHGIGGECEDVNQTSIMRYFKPKQVEQKKTASLLRTLYLSNNFRNASLHY